MCTHTNKQESIRIGSSHNRAPMPFSRDVGTKVEYKSAKPTNWQPGDYTKWTTGAPIADLTAIPPIYNQQQQQPIYFNNQPSHQHQHQSQPFHRQPQPPQHYQTQQQAYQPQHQQQYHQSPRVQAAQAPQHIRGMNSLSMQMLNMGIDMANQAHSMRFFLERIFVLFIHKRAIV